MTSLALWRDRRGAVSPTRVATLLVLVWPVLLALAVAATRGLGGRPLNDLIHRAGFWALVFLLVSLAITPLRQSARWAKLVDVRRMIGVASFVYALAHVGLYIADQGFDILHVAAEIWRRVYLLIGFIAFLGLSLLAATSNDAMVKRIGGLRWRQLHQITFAISVLALVHFFQQTKADVTVPTLYAGLFAWLAGYRLLARTRENGTLSPLLLVGLSVLAGILTLLGEAVGISLSFGVPITTVLATAFDLDLGVRPGWIVLAAGLAVAVLDIVRGEGARRRPAGRPVRARPAPAE